MAINQCVDNKFSKLFKTYLGKDPVYNFINMTEESKYCSEVKKSTSTHGIAVDTYTTHTS